MASQDGTPGLLVSSKVQLLVVRPSGLRAAGRVEAFKEQETVNSSNLGALTA